MHQHADGCCIVNDTIFISPDGDLIDSEDSFVLNVLSTHTEDDLRSAINSCFSTHVPSEYQVKLDSTTVEMSIH